MSEVVDRVATKKREAQMLVNNRMQAYRTTPSEKLLGTVSKYSVIGYLEGIKKVIADSEGLINEQEKMFEDVIQKAKSEVAKWEAEYVLIHTKALRAELKKKISAPNRERTFYLSAEEVRVPITDEAVATEIAELLKRRPDYKTYQLASGDVGAHYDIRYSGAWGKGNRTLTGANRLTKGRVEAWQKSLDNLIADLRDRNNPEVYVAQVIEIKRTTASILANWWVDTTKASKRDVAKPRAKAKPKTKK
jgi:hypothetical protein